MKLDLFVQQQTFKGGMFCVGERLYLFEEGQVLVLEGWPKLRAWRRLAGSKRFERTDPPVIIHGMGSSMLNWLHLEELPHEPFSTYSTQITHGSTYDETKKCHEFSFHRGRLSSDYPEEILDNERFNDFLEAIPQPILSRITRFTYAQWRLLAMCSKVPAFIELIDSHPALAFALVHAERFRDQPTPSLASLRNKMRLAPEKLAAWLGFPESPATVAILQKVLPSACHLEWLLKLRDQYFFEPEPPLLRRLVLIDQLTLALLVAWPLGFSHQYRDMVTEDFIIEFSALDKDARCVAFEQLKSRQDESRKFPRAAELADRQFSSIAALEAHKFEHTAYMLLNGCKQDLDDKHLALHLPEPPDFLTLLNASDAPVWPFDRRYQFKDSETVLVVRAKRVDFEGGRHHEFKDLSKNQRDALVVWLEAALTRIDPRPYDDDRSNW